MKKVLVLGCGGSGRSSFARQIGQITGLKVYHLDIFFWKPGLITTPNEEWEAFINQIVYEDEWIIDGNYTRTLDLRLKEADTVIFFDMARTRRMCRIIRRRFSYSPKIKTDIDEECREHLNSEFFKWVWNYNKNVKPIILKKLKGCSKDKEIIIFKKPSQVREYLAQYN